MIIIINLSYIKVELLEPPLNLKTLILLYHIDIDLDLETESNELNLSLVKEKAIKEFKKTYKGGYLGYQNINNFENI
jgi:hypothetical protein